MTRLHEKKLGTSLTPGGFTLVELLVVLTVLAALMAILVPVLVGVRENARRITCLNDLRQLGLGMAQYVADAGEVFPPGYNEHSGEGWAGRCYPYVRQQTVFACPDDPTETDGAGLFAVSSFGFNSNLSGYYVTDPLLNIPLSKPITHLSVLSSPSATVLFFEIENGSLPLPMTSSKASSASGNGFDSGAGMAGLGFPGGPGGQGGPVYATGPLGGRTAGSDGLAYSTPRHKGGANYVACDGHAVWLRPESVSGGSNASAPDCLQGVDGPQPVDCLGQTTPHASGTEGGKQILTFSSI